MPPRGRARKRDAMGGQKKPQSRTNLSVRKAAHLVDKNSRTMTKLSQLLEVYNRAGASDMDDGSLVAHRIERYKQRIGRRLLKLAKFVDTPELERPVEKRDHDGCKGDVRRTRKAALDNLKKKKENYRQTGTMTGKSTLAKAALEEKLKAQKAQQILRNAQLKAKGEAARRKNSLLRADGSGSDEVQPPLSPKSTATSLPLLPLPTALFPAPPQIIYCTTRCTCKHAPPRPQSTAPSYSTAADGDDGATISSNGHDVKQESTLEQE